MGVRALHAYRGRIWKNTVHTDIGFVKTLVTRMLNVFPHILSILISDFGTFRYLAPLERSTLCALKPDCELIR